MKLSSANLFTILVLTWITGSYLAVIQIGQINYELLSQEPIHILSLGPEQSTFYLTYLQTYAPYLILTSIASAFMLLTGARPNYALLALLLPWISFSYSLFKLPYPEEGNLYWQKYTPYIVARALVKKQRSPRVFQLEAKLLCYPEKQELTGYLDLLLPYRKQINLNEGDYIEVEGVLEEPPSPMHPWDLDQRAFTRKNGSFCCLKAKKLIQLKPDPGNTTKTQFSNLLTAILKLRMRIIEAHKENIGNDKGELLSSIVLGDRATSLPVKIKDDFRQVGLSHLLAASGFNLSILVGALFFIITQTKGSRSLAATAAIFAIAAFVALAGLSASVNRAASMWIMLVLFRVTYRRTNSVSLLSLSLLGFSILDPLSLIDIGLQLSYAATYSIVIGINTLSQLLENKQLSGWLKWLVDLGCVILFAQAAVLPIQLYYFWNLGLLFLPANLILDPIVAPVTVLGFISSIIVIISNYLPVDFLNLNTLASIVDKTTSIPLQIMLTTASLFASIDKSTITTGPPPLWAMFYYYLAYLFFLNSMRSTGFKLIAFAIFVSSLSFILTNSNTRADFLLVSSNSMVLVQKNKPTCRFPQIQKLPFNMARCLRYHGIDPSTKRVSETIAQPTPLASPGVLILDCQDYNLVAAFDGQGKFRPLSKRQVYAFCQGRKKAKKPVIIIKTGSKRLVKKEACSKTYLLCPGKKTTVLIVCKQNNNGKGDSKDKDKFESGTNSDPKSDPKPGTVIGESFDLDLLNCISTGHKTEKVVVTEDFKFIF